MLQLTDAGSAKLCEMSIGYTEQYRCALHHNSFLALSCNVKSIASEHHINCTCKNPEFNVDDGSIACQLCSLQAQHVIHELG